MTPKTILLLLCLLFAAVCFAQNKTVDSLLMVLQTQKEDTNRVNTLNELCYAILRYQVDFVKAMAYAEEAKQLAQKLNYQKGIGLAYKRIGNVYAGQFKDAKALEYFNTALSIFEANKDLAQQGSLHNLLSRIYREHGKYSLARHHCLTSLRMHQKTGDKKAMAYAYLDLGEILDSEENYPEALKHTYTALKLFEEIQNKEGIASTEYGIGWLEHKQGHYTEAQKRYKLALRLFEELGDTYYAAMMYRNMGEIAFLQGNYPKALKNNFIALKTFEAVPLIQPMAWSYVGIANVYEKQGSAEASAGAKTKAAQKYTEALRYYFLALKIWKQTDSKINIAEAYTNIGNVYRNLNQITEAKNYLQQSLPLITELQSKEQFKKYYQTFAQLDSVQGNFRQAYAHYKKYIAYRDSLVNEESTKKSLQIAMQYEFDKKEALAKAEQERKDAEQLRNKNRQTFYMVLLSVAMLVVLLIAFIQWRHNQQKQKANALLHQQKEKIEITLAELKATQTQLIQKEKMASLGELTAGIAHEIQNPLNFVNNFSETNVELLSELRQELKHGNSSDANAIITDAIENEQKISFHGKRADAIVKGMLQHSRINTGQKEPTDINALADEYLRLSYHGFRAKDKTFNATMKTDFDGTIEMVNLVPQDIGRVLLNLYNNAFYAVHEKAKKLDEGYEPKVKIITRKLDSKVELLVEDNGMGISKSLIDKIFQPFFTTKPTGQGTGLGLSLSYDIVKAHGGELTVTSKEEEGTEFKILLPA